MADAADFWERINRVRGSSANRRANKARNKTSAAVLFNLFCERLRTHSEVLVDLDEPQIVQTNTRNLYVFFNRRMRLRRSVGYQLSVAPTLVAGKASRAFPRRQQGTKRSARGGILDHAPARPAGKKFFRQHEHFDQPVENMSFQFRACRAGGPKHSLQSEAGRKQIAQNRGARCVGGKKREEIWRLPMRCCRQNQLLDIAKNRIK